MNINIDHNEDKTEVTLTVVLPLVTSPKEVRIFDTNDAVRILNENNVKVARNKCFHADRIRNDGRGMLEGQWKFDLKTEAATKKVENVAVESKTNETNKTTYTKSTPGRANKSRKQKKKA